MTVAWGKTSATLTGGFVQVDVNLTQRCERHQTSVGLHPHVVQRHLKHEAGIHLDLL